jgi:cytochrome b involved in lipid metabolism
MVPLFAVAGVFALVLIALVAVAARSSTSEVANTKKREPGRFSADDVALHNTRDDLWAILRLHGEAKVYDVTSYVGEHPGGDAILANVRRPCYTVWPELLIMP